MMRKVALCLDRDSIEHPEYLGLAGEYLSSQSWLEVFDSGMLARSSLQNAPEIQEVWVVSSSDIEPINLAASLKRDRPDLRIRLISPGVGGSLRSRAANASIDEVLELAAFVRIYLDMKQRALMSENTTSLPQKLDLPDPRIDASSSCQGYPMKEASEASEPQREAASLQVVEGDRRSIETEQRSRPLRVHFDREKTRKGFLMSVVSGSGGSGKSAVSVLAALDTAHKGYRTLLLDLDLQFGDVAYILRNIPSSNIDQILDDPDQRLRTFTQDAPFVVIGAPARFEDSERIGDGISDFIEDTARYFDVIVVNTGANWSEQHAILLERSSVTLFLIDQRSSSLRACNHALELCARCGIASVPFKFALNRCSKNAPFSAQDITRILQSMHVFELKDGGEEIEEYLASGNAFELRGRNNEFIASIDHMMTQILPELEFSSNVRPMPSNHMPLTRRRGSRRGKRRTRVAL